MKLSNYSFKSQIQKISAGETFFTPSRNKPFTLEAIKEDIVRIKTQEGNCMSIKFNAFESTLAYLFDKGHLARNPCLIRSHNLRSKAGPLCNAARDGNGSEIRVLTYILPILNRLGFTATSIAKVNTQAWLI